MFKSSFINLKCEREMLLRLYNSSFGNTITASESNNCCTRCLKILAAINRKQNSWISISKRCTFSSQSENIQSTRAINRYSNNDTAYGVFSKNRFSNMAMVQTSVLSPFGIRDSKHRVRQFSTISTAEAFQSVAKYLEGTPVTWVQNLFLSMHSITGLPWWAALTLSVLAIRMCLILPITLYQNHLTARLENVKYEMDGTVAKLKASTSRNVSSKQWTEKYARKQYNRTINEELKKFYIRDNCHPAKTICLTMLNFSILICESIAVANLCYMLPIGDTFAQVTRLELTLGGFGWIRNLTNSDTYLIIPFTLGLLNFSIFKIRSWLIPRHETLGIITKFRKAIIIIFPIITATISSFMPAAVTLGWLINSSCALIEMLLFAQPKFRRAVGIPFTMSEQSKPFGLLYEKMKTQYVKLKVKAA